MNVVLFGNIFQTSSLFKTLPSSKPILPHLFEAPSKNSIPLSSATLTTTYFITTQA